MKVNIATSRTNSVDLSFNILDVLKMVLKTMQSDEFDVSEFAGDLDFQEKNPIHLRDLIRELLKHELWRQMYTAFETIYGERVHNVEFIFKADYEGGDPYIAEEDMVATDESGNILQPLKGVNVREVLDDMDAGWLQWGDVGYYKASHPPIV